MKNWYQAGRMLTYDLPDDSTVVAGQIVQVGTLIGVASTGAVRAAGGDPVSVELALTGVYALPNPDGETVAKGAAVNFDLAAQKIVATGGVEVGAAFEAADGLLDVPVLLKGGSGVASGM